MAQSPRFETKVDILLGSVRKNVCGFVTIFDRIGKREIDVNVLRRMTAMIQHRGPDGEGHHVEPGLGLGHRRLAVIDLKGGDQPMHSGDGAVIVFNGEIYNFKPLRTELIAHGFQFKTQSDTEVILAAWRIWGMDFVDRLEGMFAFALWDKAQDLLVLARDRLGKKPLYYAEIANGCFLVASEMKALLAHPDVAHDDLDPTAVEDFFAYGYVPDPKTILRGVRKLPAGHTLVARRNAPIDAAKYWDVAFHDRDTSVEGAIETTLTHMDRAVRDRLIADVPLGAFLSGGVDSSGVVARMAGMLKAPVETFAIGFSDPAFDERLFADAVAQRHGTNHHLREVDRDDLHLIDKLVDIFDEPFGDSSALPTYRLAEAARRHVTVCLSGDGADEIFAGYRRYLWHHREEQLRAFFPSYVRKPVFRTLAALYPKLDWAPRAIRAKTTFHELALDAEEAYFNSVAVTNDDVRSCVFSPRMTRDLQGYRALEVLATHMRKADTDDPIKRVQYADLKTYLSGDILVKVDRTSMANSLEVRTPFLEPDLVEWAINLPTDLKLRGKTGKWILKRALEGQVPHANLHRSKMGFSVPLASWFRGPLTPDIRRIGKTSTLSESGLFNMQFVNSLIDAHLSCRRDNAPVLWQLLVFERFLAKNTSLAR